MLLDILRRQGATHQLRRIIDNDCVWHDECCDIKLALDVLKLDPADPNVDHPLADVYRVLDIGAKTNEMGI